MKNFARMASMVGALLVGLAGCSSEEENAGGGSGTTGVSGSGGAAGGQGGQAGASAGKAGQGGSAAGQGGSAAGQGGSSSGSGGASGGAGGSSGGSDAGQGGSDAGQGGSSAGAAGSVGGVGGEAGSAGAAAGEAGSAGVAGGEAGSAGVAGSAGGAGAAGGEAGSAGTAGAVGGQAGVGGAGAGGESGAGGQGGSPKPPADLTSAACGAIAVLGPQGNDVTDACQSCVETSCCTQGDACGDNAECKAFRQCIADCLDSTCSNACFETHKAGVSVSDAFSGCRRSQCGSVCANFACVGKVEWSAPAQPTFDAVLTTNDYQKNTPLVGIKVRVCSLSDVTCGTPLFEGVTDAKGQVLLKAVPTGPEGGFGAYFEYSGDAIVPALGFASGVDEEAFLKTGTIFTALLTKQTFSQFVAIAGVTPDPERGHALFNTQDCSGFSTAGLTPTASTADAKSTTVYIKGSLPTKNATQTDPSGSGAITNLPPGPVVVTGTVASSGLVYGKRNVAIRKGYVTHFNLHPTPLP